MNWNYNNEKPAFNKVKGKLGVNWQFYIDLLYKQAPSNSVQMEDFCKWLFKYLIETHPKAKVEKDSIGNIYFTKGKSDVYPCMVAHTDTAQEFHEEAVIYRTKNWVFAVDDETGEQCGLGMDDKNGIYIALEMLNNFDNIKAFFPVLEEVGCQGSSQANFNWFNDCSILIQPDRRSFTTDLISRTNGIEVCNSDLISLLLPIMKKYGYTENTGSCTDVGAIKKSNLVTCPAFNFSCGYFDEHQSSEVTNCIAFENALNFCYEVIENQGCIKHHHTSKVEERTSFIKESSYSKKYEWKEEEEEMIENDTYHQCAHFNFNNGEPDTKWWVEECLDQGICPYCEGILEMQEDFSCNCHNCESKWNISYNPVKSFVY